MEENKQTKTNPYEYDALNEAIILNKTYFMKCTPSLKGSFGEVFFGKNLQTNEEIAVKAEEYEAKRTYLEHEFAVYNDIHEYHQKNGFSLDIGIPKVYGFMSIKGYRNYLIMEQLGPDLEVLQKLCGGKFSIKTTALIGLQILDILELFHAASYNFVDIKPNNFLIGKGKHSKKIYAIDYGLAEKYKDENGKLLKWQEIYGVRGSLLYVSYYNSAGVSVHPNDDLITLGHMLFRFLKGSLPWEKLDPNMKFYRLEVQRLKIEEMKEHNLYKDVPKEFGIYMDICYETSIQELLDYKLLKKLLRDVLNNYDFDGDITFDWEMKQENI